jgi:hypothetical protein
VSISVSDRPNPSGTGKSACQPLNCCAGLQAKSGRSLLVFFQAAPLHAQQHKSKVPLVGKLAPGFQQQAFSGKVQSLSMKDRILNVNSVNGRESEIFPFKKNVRVEGINGNKLSLAEVTPGTTVLIYFNQRSGERTIKNIVILSSGKKQAKGKPAPSS